MPDLETGFRELAGGLLGQPHPDEVLLLNFAGEDSDFVRFNRGAIRQAGHVRQQFLHLTLIRGQRQAITTMALGGDPGRDLPPARQVLEALRRQLPLLPEDPYLHYATEPRDRTDYGEDRLPEATDAVGEILDATQGLDLVGLWSSGEICQGFANSFGQFNWHSSHSFHLDWSLYEHGDKAVKQDYAGLCWERERFEKKIAHGREVLPILAAPAHTITPGRYRVFLTPTALFELVSLLGSCSFGLKSQRTAQSPLLAMIREGVRLHPQLSLAEHHAAGLGPFFTPEGFMKPDQVELIRAGVYGESLVSARSAREYGAAVNCSQEQPQSLEVAPGELNEDDVLGALDTGIFVSNLWYGNYSDRNRGRITAMTRFATLWVEKGKPVAPLNAMRFDETIYNILGEKLLALTKNRERILDSSTYGGRSQMSACLPGILVDAFHFAL